MLTEFSVWLSAQPTKEALQEAAWAVPAVQCVHILALASILAAMVLMNVGVLTSAGARQTGTELDRRYLRWVWPALAIMVASGAVLIAAEPDRSITNPIFQIKMLLLLAAVAVTTAMIRSLGPRSLSQLAPGRRAGVRAMAMVSLGLWLSIAVAGRWIAYYAGE